MIFFIIAINDHRHRHIIDDSGRISSLTHHKNGLVSTLAIIGRCQRDSAMVSTRDDSGVCPYVCLTHYIYHTVERTLGG